MYASADSPPGSVGEMVAVGRVGVVGCQAGEGEEARGVVCVWVGIEGGGVVEGVLGDEDG